MALSGKLIVDCDTGVDDAVAILLALEELKDSQLLAILCVNGNCTVDEAVRNTLITLKAANKKVPVYRGCDKPLAPLAFSHRPVHSHDGLGGVSHEFSPCDESLRSGHAANLLVDLVNQHPGEITLLALGPLTNIALAYRLDSKLSSKLAKLIIMGGNTQGKGNTGLAGEFNFHADPEAAQIVLKETDCSSQLFSWELCGIDSSVPWDWFEEWMANASGRRGEFIRRIVATNFAQNRKRMSDVTGFSLCDPIAMAATLHPDIVIKSICRKAAVETTGTYTRGMLAIEWREGLFPHESNKLLELVMEIDVEKHKQLLMALMK